MSITQLSHRGKRLYRQAQEALQAGRFEEARETTERLLKDSPQFADGWFQLSLIYQQLGRFADSLQLIERALSLAPGVDRYLAQHCRSLLNLGRFTDAQTAADSAVTQGLNDAWALDTVGVVYAILDEHPAALSLFQQASQQQPHNAQYLFNLASTEQICGSLKKAAGHFQAAIELQPNFARARWNLSGLSKATQSQNHIQQLQSQLSHAKQSSMDRCYHAYALGKELEDLGKYTEAFDHYQQGAKSRRETMPYSREDSESLISTILESFAEPIQDETGYDCEEPIFIVGMPRTGTTLVERILSAHSDVYAAGELRHFAITVDRMTGGGMEVLLKPEQIKQSTTVDLEALGKAYIESTRPRTGHCRFFLDKLPLNFLYMSLIARALPKARFIHLVRNPMDTCWSNFKQLFAAVYPYSYDLEDTAHFYLLYRQLMEHWYRVLPGRILDIHYEQLVDNQASETRRLLSFCDLPWQDQCLDFHNNPNAVATASSVQVRQPLYRSSVGRWQAFRPQLKTVEGMLTAAGIAVN